jgi:type IV secretory pathway TraG/TraD family ATPase VirD4
VSGHHIDQVFLWLSDDKEREPVKMLEKAGLKLSAMALNAEYNAATEQRSGVFATARSFVEWLENRAALEWIMPLGPGDDRPEFVPEEFVRATGATLVALSKEGDGSLGPVTSALTKAILDAAEEYANACGGRVPIPLVMMLDEAANCAPIPDLPAKYSFYGGMGVFVVTILQTPSQGVAVWGETGWKQLWDAATIRVVGSGVKDMNLARDLAAQGGKYDNRRWNVSGRGGADHSTSSHTTREDKIEPDDITNLAPGQVYVVHNNGSAPFFGQTMPYWDREFAEIVKQSRAKYGPKPAPASAKVA